MSNKSKSRQLFLICTGLGTVKRGFETYISDLGEKLTVESNNEFSVSVFSGGNYSGSNFKSIRIPCISRNNNIAKYFFSQKTISDIELITFFLSLIPIIILQKPKAIYLGEYKLYCFLFKFRKLLNLKYSLILFTGGQTCPGLFDIKKDYIHHVTDIYYRSLIEQGISIKRQFIIPHFINEEYIYNEKLAKNIKAKSGSKKIVLSVGYIDKTIKRMNLFVRLLSDIPQTVFPIILGEFSDDTNDVEEMLIYYFGKDGYILDRVSRKELGTYYSLADLFILCSPKESFGLASVEALYFGKPVISDDFYESRFVLKDQAIIVNMKNEVKTQKVISDILLGAFEISNIERRKRFVEKNYTWKSLSNRYFTMFSEIINS